MSSVPHGRVISRNRERLACTQCRRRKLRCDRTTPCGACTRRGDPNGCGYEFQTPSSEGERQRLIDAEARLAHLEQLVRRLATQQQREGFTETGPSAAGPSGAETSTGKAPVALGGMPRQQPSEAAGSAGNIAHSIAHITDGPSPSESVYAGWTHWSAMLEDIQELRFAITPVYAAFPELEPGQPFDSPEGAGISLLFGSGPSLSVKEVLREFLPPRQEADRLTSAYFRSGAIAAPFLPAVQFRRLYAAFWADPGATPPLWASIFFTICHISINTLRLGGHWTTQGDSSVDYRYSVAAAHCLVAGEVFRPKRFAVESLVLFAQAQCLTAPELTSDISSILGLLVRLATTMGYHRDPDTVNLQVSPFEKEMRRRVWSACMQLDLIVSFHLGLPSGIQPQSWDTRCPRALAESDLVEDATESLDSQPEHENATIFYIAKHKFMAVFARILQHTLSTGSTSSSLALLSTPPPPSLQPLSLESSSLAIDPSSLSPTGSTVTSAANLATVDALDAEMRAVYAAMPPRLARRSMANSVVDSPALILTRLCVSFLFHKCLCVLHRPYVAHGRAASVLACYEASTGLVGDYVEAFREFSPGGQIETEPWFLGSLSRHDFLFGIVALCMVLHASVQFRQQGQGGGGMGVVDVPASLSLLRQAQVICSGQAVGRSRETKTVLSLIEATLQRLGSGVNSLTTDPNQREAAAAWSSMGGMSLAPAEQAQHQHPKDAWAWPGKAVAAVPSVLDESSWAYLEQFIQMPYDYDMDGF